jgi:hypothetical protein
MWFNGITVSITTTSVSTHTRSLSFIGAIASMAHHLHISAISNY